MNILQQIALTKIKGVGPKTARLLMAYCGGGEAIFKASKKELMSIPGIGRSTVASILSKDYMTAAEEELTFMERHSIEALWIEDKAYPQRLRHCEDAPLLLFYKGQCALNAAHTVSIVGTRNATAYGRKICEELLWGLKKLDLIIISGLAYGIDALAHRISLNQQIPTVAVLGHGLAMIYPREHRELARRISQQGGLISEFPAHTNPEKSNFPARNRIIAGLSDVTIVVEAALKGGALITAELANSYNRDVCAFPGAVDQPYSAGCNSLIQNNRAHLIRHSKDLLSLMNWEPDTVSTPAGKQLSLIPHELSEDQHFLYRFLASHDQRHIDDITLYAAWPMSKVVTVLLELEMNGHIIALPGKQYKTLST